MNRDVQSALTTLLLLSAIPVVAQIPAFPGAEGFGAYATGGRGGDVYTVVNLHNDGSGSLQYGLDTAPAGGRTIVFAVSGYIPVTSDTQFDVPANVTLAGQTAPGDGIGLKDGRMLISGDNVIMRHFRIRHGKYGTGGDCLNLSSSAHDSIIDHVTMMFSTDENISFFNSTLDDFTMQYSTSSWGMERHNAGGLWDLVDGSCHHSLWAHHTTRNPKARPYGLLEWINNVTFDYGTGFIMGDSESNVDWYANVMGCYYLSIPSYRFGLTGLGLSDARIASDGAPNFHLYLDDCLHDSNDDGWLNGTDKGYGIVEGLPYPQAGTTPGTVSYDQASTPFAGAPVPVAVDDPLAAYKNVISSGGALRLDASATSLRDELDTLLIDSVMNQEVIMVAKDSPVDPDAPPSNGEQLLADQYGISNNGFGTLNSATAPADADGDGMPDRWELAVGSNPDVQNHNTLFANNGSIITAATFFPPDTPAGYTYLEEYLHFCAVPHAFVTTNSAAQPSSLTVDLSRYTCGFVNGASFTISGTYGGTIQQYAADGTTPSSTGPVVTFTPTQGVAGRAGFDFSVTDADGSTWTQPFAILAAPDVVYVAPPELLAYYPMEGNVNDDSGNGNDAAASGSPAYPTGHMGQAIDLDGSDDFVSLPSGVANSDDITVAAWVKWNGGGSWQRIFDFGNNTTEYMYLTPSSGGGALRFAITTGGAGGEQAVETAPLPIGEWTHVAAKLEGDTASLYVDGSLVGSNPAVAVNPGDFSPANNWIGESQWSDPLLDGQVDEFRVYNYALSDAEIAELAAADGDRLQAENASYGNGSVFENSNAGFNGTGYVNFNANGGYLEFTGLNGGAGGDTSLDIRYALGAAGTRTGRLVVNGVSRGITFNSTSAWSTWNTTNLTVTLNSGTGNTIRFEASGEDLANIDQIFLTLFEPDSDGDGLEDAWEIAHFGNLDQTGTDDPDGDGDDNETEETHGTPPTISSIPPDIDASIAAGTLNLNWSGNHTGWRLLHNTNLMSDTWAEVPGSDTTNVYETPVSGLLEDTTFYSLIYP